MIPGHTTARCTLPNAQGTQQQWSACYTFTSTKDASQHATLTETDGWGRTVVTQADSGTGTSGDPYAVYAITSYRYDDAGRLVRLVAPDDTHTTSFTYDGAGRQTGLSDPDRGTESATYDPNGNLTHASDARGQLVYTGYDGLNRPLWRNTSPAPSGAYVSYSYDSTANGNVGIGYLTGESFSNANAPGGGALSGSYAYTYDTRGQTTSMTQTLGGTGGGTHYSFATAYDDSGQPTSLTYPDGEVLSLGEDASSGWPTSAVTTPAGGGAAINLATGLSYSGSGNAGAAGAVTSASIGNGVYTYAASYDGDLRPTSASTTLVADGATLFSSGRTYDALGNVTSATTTLAAGTDTQAFCYDDLYRLTWAASVGATPGG